MGTSGAIPIRSSSENQRRRLYRQLPRLAIVVPSSDEDRPLDDKNLPRYDRDFLLSSTKRNQVIELWEVEKFGRDSFGDPEAVSLYDMTPSQWYARGVRILARTTLEAVRDPLGRSIGQDVARMQRAILDRTPIARGGRAWF
jgi:hypothetical protein